MKRIIFFLIAIIIINTIKAQFTCGDSLLDIRDGQYYQTVQIGDQCWMAENLNIGIMVNSINPTLGADSLLTQTNNDIIEKYCYNDSIEYCFVYGGLYQWDEMMVYGLSDIAMTGTTQGICPTGWHIPTHHEWTTLERAVCTSGTCETDFPYDFTTIGYQGTDEGGKLKEIGITHWDSPNTGATNESGFTALPGGYRLWYNGSFQNLSHIGYFWSATEGISSFALGRFLPSNKAEVIRFQYEKWYSHSIRCLMDTDALSSLTIPQENLSISIYPNPSDKILNIMIKSVKNEEYDIEITNIEGQVIIRKKTKPSTKIVEHIDISKYPNGVYFVKITGNEMTKTEKVILE